MGIDGLMSELGMNAFATIALVIFFCVFLAIVVWTWRRPRRDIEEQARIPLNDDVDDERHTL